jgi:hypothetical protein
LCQPLFENCTFHSTHSSCIARVPYMPFEPTWYSSPSPRPYPLVPTALEVILRVGENRARHPCILKDMKLASLHRFVRAYGEG